MRDFVFLEARIVAHGTIHTFEQATGKLRFVRERYELLHAQRFTLLNNTLDVL